MSNEQPKKPKNAYWLFLDDVRSKLFAECPPGEKKTAWVARQAGEKFKALAPAEKAKYDDKAASLKKAYEVELEKFKAEGGTVQKKKRKSKGGDNKGGDKDSDDVVAVDDDKDDDDDDAPPDGKKAKRAKKERDPDLPKKPAGGAYGCYVAAHRAEIMKEIPGKRATEISKIAGVRWKALPPEDRKPYEDEYQKKKAAYEEAMKKFKAKKPGSSAGPAAGDDDDDDEDE